MIREALIKDIYRIVEIESEWGDYFKWKKEGFLKEFEKEFSKTFVYDDGIIKGFINIWNLDVIEINTLVVSKKFIRNGIGNSLLNYIIKLANKKIITLEVNEKNTNAISLYLKNGFKIYGKRKNYYGSSDALLMRREDV
jgi:ribosomal-protein-alanine N-acetyltransferase